jgi:hypothetical protein
VAGLRGENNLISEQWDGRSLEFKVLEGFEWPVLFAMLLMEVLN